MNFDKMCDFLINLKAYSDRSMADAVLSNEQRSEFDAQNKRKL